MPKIKCMVCKNDYYVKGKFLTPCIHCNPSGIKEKPKYVKRSANNR